MWQSVLRAARAMRTIVGVLGSAALLCFLAVKAQDIQVSLVPWSAASNTESGTPVQVTQDSQKVEFNTARFAVPK